MDPKTQNAFLQLARSVDLLAGNVAGLTAYVAALPNAASVDLPATTTNARHLAPSRLAGTGNPTPADFAATMVSRIHGIAKSLDALKTPSQSEE
jgi:hypothetical protein